MNSHEYYEELLSLRLDGLLTDEQERELEEHLESCPGCRETLELLSGVRETLDIDAEPPEGLADAVMDAVRGDIRAKRAVKRRRISIGAGLFAAAAVLAVAVIPGALRQKNTKMDSRPVLYSAPEAPAVPASPAMPEVRDAQPEDALPDEPAVCDIIDGQQPVFDAPADPDVPDEQRLPLIDALDGYAAVYTFAEIPEELVKAGEPLSLDDGAVGYALPMELLEQYEAEALMVETCGDPTAALGIALERPDGQGQ